METNDELLPQLTLASDCDAVILAGGEKPDTPFTLQALGAAKRIVCCDGAYRTLISLAPTKSDFYVVGDGDSLTQEEKDALGTRFHHVAEQADNDLTKGIRFAAAQGWKRLLILGATGHREDHTIANLSLLLRYNLSMNLQVSMLTNYGLFQVFSGLSAIKAFPKQQISIFNIDCRHLSSEGLQYSAYPYAELWQGTLNEAQDRNFFIDADGHFLLFFLAGKKSPDN